MNDIARGFRDSKLDLLELIASPEAQRTFASDVPYDDYASEFYCLWFDDFYPDSDLMHEAFLPEELDTLRSFSTAWEREDVVIKQTGRSIEELLANDNWRSVVEAAKQAAASFRAEQPNKSVRDFPSIPAA